MAITYSTSADCAAAAGIRNLGANSNPKETQIDSWRSDAKTLIVEIIGDVADNSLGTCKQIERHLVKKQIYAYIDKNPDYEMELTPLQQQRLVKEFFSFSSGSLIHSPGANT